MGQKGGLPTVCSGLSQEGNKGQDRGRGPGGQVRRAQRDTRGRSGARGVMGKRSVQELGGYQEQGKGWVTVGDNQGLKGLGEKKKRTRAPGGGKGSRVLEGHCQWGECRMAMGAARGSQGMLWERESVG